MSVEITTEEFADLLQLKRDDPERVRKARRRMRKLGIDRQDTPRGQVYTTMADLRERAAHIWAEAVTQYDAD